MEFETTLSKEEIRLKLLSLTKPLKILGGFPANTFLSKWKDNGTFYLLQTGAKTWAKHPTPFVGKVIERENTTMIVGNFGLMQFERNILLCFFGYAWTLVSFNSFLNPNFDLVGKAFVFIVLSIWTALGYALFQFAPRLFRKEKAKATRDFIEQHLCGESGTEVGIV